MAVVVEQMRQGGKPPYGLLECRDFLLEDLVELMVPHHHVNYDFQRGDGNESKREGRSRIQWDAHEGH